MKRQKGLPAPSFVTLVGHWLPSEGVQVTPTPKVPEHPFFHRLHVFLVENLGKEIDIDDGTLSSFIGLFPSFPQYLDTVMEHARSDLDALVRMYQTHPIDVLSCVNLNGPTEGTGESATVHALPRDVFLSYFAQNFGYALDVIRLCHTHLTHGDLERQASEFLTLRFVPIKGGGYVGRGHLFHHNPDPFLTAVYTEEEVASLIKEQAPFLRFLLSPRGNRPSLLKQWMDRTPAATTQSLLDLDIHIDLTRLSGGGVCSASPHLNSVIGTKAGDPRAPFPGAPLILLAHPTGAYQVYQDVVADLRAVFGPPLVADGTGRGGCVSAAAAKSADPETLFHVHPPFVEKPKQALNKILGADPPGPTWHIVILPMAPLDELVSSVFPTPMVRLDSFVLLMESDNWSVDHADQARLRTLSPPARILYDAVVDGGSYTSLGPDLSLPDASLALQLGTAGEESAADVFIMYTGATLVDTTLYLTPLDQARNVFIRELGLDLPM